MYEDHEQHTFCIPEPRSYELFSTTPLYYISFCLSQNRLRPKESPLEYYLVLLLCFCSFCLLTILLKILILLVPPYIYVLRGISLLLSWKCFPMHLLYLSIFLCLFWTFSFYIFPHPVEEHVSLMYACCVCVLQFFYLCTPLLIESFLFSLIAFLCKLHHSLACFAIFHYLENFMCYPLPLFFRIFLCNVHHHITWAYFTFFHLEFQSSKFL